MAAIEINEERTRCLTVMRFTEEEIRNHLEEGYRVKLFVDGWTDPWELLLEEGEIRAQCPASKNVRPLVEWITKKQNIVGTGEFKGK